MKFNKLKSIFLSSALAISIFFTGCSNGDQNTITNQTQIKDSTSSNSQVTVESNSSYQSASKEVPKGSVKATIERVVDGDTMKLKLDKTKEVVTLRLLLVDTPESVKKGVDPQPYSIEASNFAKNTLKAGDTVYIEYDEGDKTDKYDRHLVWIYVDDILLQKDLIEKGYAKVAYLYGDYLYTDELKEVEEVAKKSGVGIWSDSTNQEKTEENEEYNIIEKIIDQICEILEKLIEILTDFINDMV